MGDKIDHPLHYNKGDIECIDYILDQDLGFVEGNIVKYMVRWKDKDGLDDLKKARWYLNKLIEVTEKNGIPKVPG